MCPPRTSLQLSSKKGHGATPYRPISSSVATGGATLATRHSTISNRAWMRPIPILPQRPRATRKRSLILRRRRARSCRKSTPVDTPRRTGSPIIAHCGLLLSRTNTATTSSEPNSVTNSICGDAFATSSPPGARRRTPYQPISLRYDSRFTPTSRTPTSHYVGWTLRPGFSMTPSPPTRKRSR